MRRLREISRDQKGATAVEYGLILALIFLAIVSGVTLLAATTTGTTSRAKCATRGDGGPYRPPPDCCHRSRP